MECGGFRSFGFQGGFMENRGWVLSLSWLSECFDGFLYLSSFPEKGATSHIINVGYPDKKSQRDKFAIVFLFPHTLEP